MGGDNIELIDRLKAELANLDEENPPEDLEGSLVGWLLTEKNDALKKLGLPPMFDKDGQMVDIDDADLPILLVSNDDHVSEYKLNLEFAVVVDEVSLSPTSPSLSLGLGMLDIKASSSVNRSYVSNMLNLKQALESHFDSYTVQWSFGSLEEKEDMS